MTICHCSVPAKLIFIALFLFFLFYFVDGNILLIHSQLKQVDTVAVGGAISGAPLVQISWVQSPLRRRAS